MKIYYPSFYKNFICIAGDCPDSCCKKWEIVIDEETCRKYAAVSGEIGEKIRQSLVYDKEGNRCFKLAGDKCPFLNDKGLCDIHIELGEAFTSDICKVHPRFVEEYDGFTEISLSASCPEANRIMFESETENEEYPIPEYFGDDEVLELLIDSRKTLLGADCDFQSLVTLILNTSADDSLDIDMVYIADFPEFNMEFLREYLNVLARNEILTDKWRSMLGYASEGFIGEIDFDRMIEAQEKKLIKFCRYLIYRYYLKAVNDLDIYSRALFIISSCFVCVYLSLISGESFEECVRLFSKETEHNTENIDNLLTYFRNF